MKIFVFAHSPIVETVLIRLEKTTCLKNKNLRTETVLTGTDDHAPPPSFSIN